MVDDQLTLPLPGERTPATTEVRPELVAFRSRSALWERTPSSARQFCTVREILDRVRLCGLLSAGGRALRDDGAVLWAAARELAERSPRAVRLARDLAGLHAGWAHGGVDLGRIKAGLEGQGGRHAEILALAGLLERLRERLGRASVVDGATALSLGARAIVEEGRVPFSLRRYQRLVIRHWVDPTELELEAMLALARAGVSMRFVLPVDPGGRGLTAAIGWIFEAVYACHDAPDLELDHESLGERASTRAFCESWYSGSVESAALMADVPVRVEVARDPADEARRIAGVVAAWAHEEQPMPRIAVAVRSLDAHADRVEDALLAYGLPVMRREGRALTETAPGQVLSELLRLRRDGVPRERLLALLTQPAYRGARPVAEVGGFAAVLRRAAARTDVEDRTRPTGGYRHRLERYIESKKGQRGDPAEVARARAALEAIEEVLELLAALPAKAPLPVLLEQTRALIDRAIDPVADEAAFRQLREVITDGERSLARVLFADELDEEGATGPVVDLAAFRRLLLRALAGQRLPPEPHRAHHAVELCALPQLLGRRFDYVVMADCVDGRLPLAERSDPLLTDGDRALINEAVGARVLKWAQTDPLEPAPVAPKQALEPLWFLGGAAAADRGLLITAAGRDMRGRELAPSVFLQEALLALGASPGDQAAGPAWEALPHPRRGKLSAAHDVHRGGEGAGLDDDERELARAFDEMASERRAYFQRDPSLAPDEATAPFAYRIDPSSFEGRFGYLLGLDKDRPLTPTRLESLATCRFRGFVEQMLRVDTELAAGQDADARALGSLAHSVLERFYDERAGAEADPGRIDDRDHARLRELVDEEAAPMKEGRETGHLAALEANISWLKTSLTRTVTLLAHEPPVPGARPYRFELNIGVDRPDKPKVADAVELPLGPRSIWIGGEIDRIDRSDRAWVVVDYKNSTGSKVRSKVREKELFQKHFQLPLYLRLIASYVRLRPSIELAAYLISLRDGVASQVLGEDVGMRRRITDDDAEDGLAKGVARVVLPLLEGAVPADEGHHCRGCRVSRVCRRPQAGAGLVGSAGGSR